MNSKNYKKTAMGIMFSILVGLLGASFSYATGGEGSVTKGAYTSVSGENVQNRSNWNIIPLPFLPASVGGIYQALEPLPVQWSNSDDLGFPVAPVYGAGFETSTQAGLVAPVCSSCQAN